MKALIIAIMLAFAATSPASAFCFKEMGSAFHKKQAAPVATPGPVSEIRPTRDPPKPGDSFCKQVMRGAAVSLVVQSLVIGLKVGAAVLFAVPLI